MIEGHTRSNRGLGDYGTRDNWHSQRPTGAPWGATYSLEVHGMAGQPEDFRPPRQDCNREYYDPLPSHPMTRDHSSNQWANSEFRYSRTGRCYGDDARTLSDPNYRYQNSYTRRWRFPLLGRGSIPHDAIQSVAAARARSLSPSILHRPADR
jgi:hypothetical protein